MIKQLRKRHLQIWILWAVLLPVGIIAGWLAVPGAATNALLQPEPGTALPVKIQTIEKESYTATLRSNEEKTQYQLEWINKKASTVPSSLIYYLPSIKAVLKIFPTGGDLEGAELIGRIDARGTYCFPLSNDSASFYNFILYDIIKKKIIDSVNFKTPF